MMEEEKLLNAEEIAYVNETANNSPFLKQENAIGFPDDWLSIIKMSPINGLIFISGNHFTGFKHISDRHSYYSKESFWNKAGDGTHILDNPSKFSKLSIPIFEFTEIVDQLYAPSKINAYKNKRPDTFEMYSSNVSLNGVSELYHMLLYKNTKIIHTLFPNSKKNNRKKLLNLSKGKATGFIDEKTGLTRLTVSYFKHDKTPAYSFQIVIDKNENKQVWLVYNHSIKGTIKLHEKQNDLDGNLQTLIMGLEYSDMTEMEKLIRDLELNQENYL